STRFRLFDHRQHLAGIHRLTDDRTQGGDAARFRSLQFVLHLHGLDHDDACSRLNFSSHFHQDAHYFPRHGGADLGLAVIVTTGTLSAAQTLGIDDRNVISRAPQVYDEKVRTLKAVAHLAVV